MNKLVAAVAGRTSYSASVNTIVPAGSYKAAVYWRATIGSGAWTPTQKSAAFTIATLGHRQPHVVLLATGLDAVGRLDGDPRLWPPVSSVSAS